MKKHLIFLSVAVLSGCTTYPQELRNDAPYRTYQSSHSGNDIATCLVQKLESRTYSGVAVQASIKPIYGGMSVTAINNNELIDLIAKGGGTEVNFYSAIQKNSNVWRSESRTVETVSDIEGCL